MTVIFLCIEHDWTSSSVLGCFTTEQRANEYLDELHKIKPDDYNRRVVQRYALHGPDDAFVPGVNFSCTADGDFHATVDNDSLVIAGDVVRYGFSYSGGVHGDGAPSEKAARVAVATALLEKAVEEAEPVYGPEWPPPPSTYPPPDDHKYEVIEYRGLRCYLSVFQFDAWGCGSGIRPGRWGWSLLNWEGYWKLRMFMGTGISGTAATEEGARKRGRNAGLKRLREQWEKYPPLRPKEEVDA